MDLQSNGLSQLLNPMDNSFTGDNFVHQDVIPNAVTLLSPQLNADGDIVPGQLCNHSSAQLVDFMSPNSSVDLKLEYEPDINDDNTEVKVLFNEPKNDELNVSDIVKDDTFLNVYTKLATWYRDLPEGMFISRLVRENETETALYETRQLLFDALKAYDDFPFDLNSELKRRVGTRKVRLVVKLATDIPMIGLFPS